MTFIESAEQLKKAWAKHLQAIDAELHITERVRKLIRKTYKYEWETPPKFEPPMVNTTCVSVIGALLDEVPNQTDCEACELDGKADVCKICRVSNYEPQTECRWK